MSSWKPEGKGGCPLQSACFEKDPGLQGAREKRHQYQAGAEAQGEMFPTKTFQRMALLGCCGGYRAEK